MSVFEKRKLVVVSNAKNQILLKCSKCKQKQILLYKQPYGRRIHNCIKCGCKYSVMLSSHRIERVDE